MNRKRIEKNLLAKHKEFIASITDEKVRRLVNENSIITGGAIVSMFQGEQVNDYDYYFTNKETCLEVAKYYAKDFAKRHPNKLTALVTDTNGRIAIKVQSAGVVSEGDKEGTYRYFETLDQQKGTDYLDAATEVLEDTKVKTLATTPDLMISEADDIGAKELDQLDGSEDAYRPVFLSSNAITLSNDIQLVIRFYGEPEEIHENYDFVHCTNYWLSSDREVHVNADALECTLTKELKYNGSKYPLASIIRTRKFIQRGWKINAGQYFKMCFQVSKLDLESVEVLRDQLVGVDSAYFAEVISAIDKKRTDEPDWKLDDSYLTTLIDKIF
jgi:hypothetical protein